MPDNMEEGVKTLILELPDIVKKNTRNEYPEVKDALISLEQYVKGKNATKYGTLQKLTELEGLLSTKKQEKSPNILQHITKIRRYWENKEGKPIAKRLLVTGSEVTVHPRRDQDMASEITFFEQSLRCLREMFKKDEGGALKDMFQLPKEKQLKQKVKNGHETLVAVGEEIRRMKSEKEHWGNVLQKLSSKVIVSNENTTDVDDNAFKMPKSMEKLPDIAAIYKYAADISKRFHELNGEIRRMKSEKEHWGNVLQKLSSKVIVSNENTTDVDDNAFKMPKSMEKLPDIAAIYKYAADISKRFHVLNGDLNFACRRMSELLSAVKEQGKQEPGPTKNVQNQQAKGRKQDKDPSITHPIFDQTKKLDNDFCHIQSELKSREKLIQDAQNQIRHKQLLESIMDDLSKDVQGLIEGSTEVKTQSALDERKASIERDKESSTYQRLEQANTIYERQIEIKREADYAAQLLEELNNFIQKTDKSVEDTSILTKPDTPGSINEGKENQPATKKKNQSNNVPARNQQSIHAKKLQKCFESATSILHKYTDVRGQIEQKQFIESTMDDLSKDVQDLVEGKKKIDTQSALDQKAASIDRGKESLKFQRLIQAKNIYELHFELKREADYAAQLLEELNHFIPNDNSEVNTNVLSNPESPTPIDEGNQNQIVQGRKKQQNNNEAGRNQPSRHFLQKKKCFDTALSVLNKQIEAKYAAQLLDELGYFSKNTGDSDKHRLSDPPTKATQSRNGSKQNKEEISQRNERARAYFEKAKLILNQIKERQRQEEKEDVKVKHLKDGQKNTKETGDSLKADIKTESKQKGQDKLQRLEEENIALRKEADSLRLRLSQVAGAKLAHENPAITDLSDPNRPTKLGEKYSQLYDNEWTEAYTALLQDDKSASDEKLTRYLYNILIDSYRFCEGIRKTQKKSLEDILFHPAVNMESSLISQMKGVREIVAKYLSDATKVSGDVACLNMVQAFEMNKDMKTKYGKKMKQCKAFIEECVKLCWLMHVQTPPLCIDTKTTRGEQLEKEKYKEYTTKGQKIAFVVWPALFLHENGPLVAKGVAQGE